MISPSHAESPPLESGSGEVVVGSGSVVALVPLLEPVDVAGEVAVKPSSPESTEPHPTVTQSSRTNVGLGKVEARTRCGD
jgi:hypothetical protein